MQLELKKREIIEIKSDAQRIATEAEKWQTLYRRTLEEMQTKKPDVCFTFYFH